MEIYERASFLREYELLDHMKIIPENFCNSKEIQLQYYIPHNGV